MFHKDQGMKIFVTGKDGVVKEVASKEELKFPVSSRSFASSTMILPLCAVEIHNFHKTMT